VGLQSKKVSNRGPAGAASVKVLKKSVRVAFESGMVWEGTVDDAPKGIFTTPKAFVSLDAGETKIRGFRPYEGKFLCNFVDIYCRTDDDGDEQPPEPVLVEAKQISWTKGGKTQSATIPTHQEFTAVLELVGSEWEGTKAFLNLWYMFEDDGTGAAMQVGRGSEIDKVNKFLKCAGFDFVNDGLKYSDNVLPALRKLLKTKGPHEFLVEFGKGYTKGVEDLPVGLGSKKPKAKAKMAAKPAAKRGRPKKAAPLVPEAEDEA